MKTYQEIKRRKLLTYFEDHHPYIAELVENMPKSGKITGRFLLRDWIPFM